MFVLGFIDGGYVPGVATPAVVPVYGYFAGGNSGAIVNTTDRITFSTGATAANTASNLSTNRRGPAGVSDKVTYGYFAGGSTTTGSASVVTADRITFSTGATAANATSNLSQARYTAAGLSDGVTYGYFGGGYTGGQVVTADRITFSSGTTAANTASNLSVARDNLAALSDGVTYGYFLGGQTGATAAGTNGDRIVFSTGVTSSNTASNLSSVRESTAAVSDSTTYGYITGGATSNTQTPLALTDRILYSSGVTSAATTSNLVTARNQHVGVGDGVTYGYIAGGNTGAMIATAERIVFSTGVFSANTVSNLSVARTLIASLCDYDV